MPETRHFPYDLVMFDLDGTLIETAAELSDALNDTLAGLGCAPVAESLVGGWIGNGTGELLIRGLAESTGQAPGQLRGSELARRALAIFDPCYERRCGTRSRLYPHAAQVLRQLRARGVHLAVVTNKDGSALPFSSASRSANIGVDSAPQTLISTRFCPGRSATVTPFRSVSKPR